jgi:hypothetical protein
MFVSMLLVAAAALTAAPADKADFYVSPDGLDSNPGSLKKPFATIDAAQNAVRGRIAEGLKKDIEVVLLAGSYHRTTPLMFSPLDSGTQERRITYRAYPGEKVWISGGRVISGWTAGEKNRWTVTLPQVADGSWRFRQLFADGKRLSRGRFPNAPDLMRVAGVSEDLTGIVVDASSGVEDLSSSSAELVMFQNWSISRSLIDSSNDRTLKLRNPMGWIGHGPATSASTNKPTYIENALALVDVPGEWYLDETSGVLSYQAAEGEDPNTRVFVAPVAESLVSVTGTSEQPVRNIHFEGINFGYTRWNLPETGYMGIQAGHYGTNIKKPTYVLPLAIAFLYAEQCSVTNSRIAHTGACGIGFGAGSRSNRVEACTIEDIGGNGVMVGWRGMGEMLPTEKGEDSFLSADWREPFDVPLSNTITRNLIQRCGAINHGCVGIFDAFAQGTLITRNVVREMPYTGISSGFRWNESKTSQKEGLIANNHVHDVMKMLADGGCLYTLGFQPGAIIRGNVFHDAHRSDFAHGGAPNNGIFFDQGSKGFLVEENTIYDTSGEPVRFNQTNDEKMTWKNNRFGVGAGSVIK